MFEVIDIVANIVGYILQDKFHLLTRTFAASATCRRPLPRRSLYRICLVPVGHVFVSSFSLSLTLHTLFFFMTLPRKGPVVPPGLFIYRCTQSYSSGTLF